ncbi:MAG: hypothetical protein DRO94_02590 [Candidatus Altiarchaeales archaeon]|nr:MAG: hypothetical protein DRO94_02590 [Candidatus Altiarchaeales archaeon]HDO82146.1 winged helix-turn-helix transcriptional regulator [Candidatus Altiarchaeales archaeon]HEX54795.1 winged helix-turn-helix transcriptional regulator [Candidatus Altiarchaeales archaeon]
MKSIISGILIVVLMCQLASGAYVNIFEINYGISKINVIEINIQENGFSQINIEFTPNNTEFSFIIPEGSEDMSLNYDTGNKIVPKQRILNNRKEISANIPADRLNSNFIFSYFTPAITSKNASTWAVSFTTSSTPRHTIVKINFPQYSTIVSWDRTALFTKIDNSLWVYPQNTSFLFECTYETMQHLTQDNNNNIYLYSLIGFSLLILVLLLVLYIFVSRKWKEKSGETSKTEEDGEEDKEKKTRIKSSILNVLDENERRIVEILEKFDEEVTQAYIYKTTGIPKATLSDIMRRLENRNIIKRRRDGRTNWVSLEDWVFSK